MTICRWTVAVVAVCLVAIDALAGEKLGTTEGRAKARQENIEADAEIETYTTLTNELASANSVAKINAALTKWAAAQEKAKKGKKPKKKE